MQSQEAFVHNFKLRTGYIQPFLSFPCTKDFHITEGWKYSEAEKKYHGKSSHGGIDFAFPVGTPVLAAHDGFAIASYGFSFVTQEDANRQSTARLVDGHLISMSIGLFVQIYNPHRSIFTQYGHLSKLADVPFYPPRFDQAHSRYIPMSYRIPLAQYKIKGQTVKAGDCIGYVGVSGITFDAPDYPKLLHTIRKKAWDESHLHFQVFLRSQNQQKAILIDPFGIYSQEQYYPYNAKYDPQSPLRHNALWLKS